jgi:hypothetical protein
MISTKLLELIIIVKHFFIRSFLFPLNWVTLIILVFLMTLSRSVLLATEKPFAPDAVQKIESVLRDSGYTLVKLEKYSARDQLLGRPFTFWPTSQRQPTKSHNGIHSTDNI